MTEQQQFLQMVTESLQLMAAKYDDQIRALPEFVHRPDEVALIFEDCIPLAEQLVDAGVVAPDALSRMRHINDLLKGYSGGRAQDFWTTEAMKDDPRWEQLRSLARDAILSLGQSVRSPALDWVSYVEGGRTRPDDGVRTKT